MEWHFNPLRLIAVVLMFFSIRECFSGFHWLKQVVADCNKLNNRQQLEMFTNAQLDNMYQTLSSDCAHKKQMNFVGHTLLLFSLVLMWSAAHEQDIVAALLAATYCAVTTTIIAQTRKLNVALLRLLKTINSIQRERN